MKTKATFMHPFNEEMKGQVIQMNKAKQHPKHSLHNQKA